MHLNQLNSAGMPGWAYSRHTSWSEGYMHGSHAFKEVSEVPVQDCPMSPQASRAKSSFRGLE